MPRARVTARHYGEQLAWWYASPWAMEVEEMPDGGLWLHTAKRRGSMRVWGARAAAEEVKTPTQVRLFLALALYLHLHPRKALAAHTLTGFYCTDKELAAFIRQQRRKLLARPLMWVARDTTL